MSRRRRPWWPARLGWTCRSATRWRSFWQAGSRCPRPSLPCWRARCGTSDAARHHHRGRLDHGQPRPGLLAGHHDRRPGRRRAGGGRVLRGAAGAQPVPPPVRRGRVQRRLRAGVLRHPDRGGAGAGQVFRAGGHRRDGLLAAGADRAGRDFHAADDASAGAGLHGDPRQGRADGGAGPHHLPLRSADLPDGAVVRRAERAGPVRGRGRGAAAVQRCFHRLHAAADPVRAHGGAFAGLGGDDLGGAATGVAGLGRAAGGHDPAHPAPSVDAPDARAAAAHGAGAAGCRGNAVQPGDRRDHRQPAAAGFGQLAVLCGPGEPVTAGRDRHRGRHGAAAAAVPPSPRGRPCRRGGDDEPGP